MLILEMTLSPNEEKHYQRNHDDDDRSNLFFFRWGAGSPSYRARERKHRPTQ
jgi:hypothetical protein